MINVPPFYLNVVGYKEIKTIVKDNQNCVLSERSGI